MNRQTISCLIGFLILIFSLHANAVQLHDMNSKENPKASINHLATNYQRILNNASRNTISVTLEAQRQLSTMKDDTSKVNALIRIVQSADLKDVNQLEQYASLALKLSEKLGYKKGLAYSKYYLGTVFINYDFNYTQMLILESLKLAQEIKDSLLIARLYNLIGNLRSNLGDTAASLSYYNKALSILINSRNDSMAAGVYNNVGNYYSIQSKHEKSLLYFKKAAAINIRTGNSEWLIVNYTNIGNEYSQMQQISLAISYFEKALHLATVSGLNRILPSVYYNLSSCFFKNKDYGKAKEYAKASLAIGSLQLDRMNEKCTLELLNDIYFISGELDSAYLTQKAIIAVKDSIYKYSKIKELDLLEMRYKYEDERKQNEIAAISLKNKQYRNELAYAIGLALLVITLLVITTQYVLQKNRISKKVLEQEKVMLEKEKLSNDLEHKNKELTTNLMYLLKKNELISDISEKLKSEIKTEQGQSVVIQDVISELDKNINSDSWMEFERRFQEVHVNFYNQLIKSFPDLTPNELKICAFLKLNMTTKEIATITYQSVDSIKVARYRLRKKLGLARDENLISFLTQY